VLQTANLSFKEVWEQDYLLSLTVLVHKEEGLYSEITCFLTHMVGIESGIHILTWKGMKKFCSYVPTEDKQQKREIYDCDIISRSAFSETPNTDICTFGVHVCYIILCVCVCVCVCIYSDWLRDVRLRGRSLSLCRVKNFSFLVVQTGTHPGSCTMDTAVSFPGIKAAEVLNSPLTSN
jgi:hypothetical protein